MLLRMEHFVYVPSSAHLCISIRGLPEKALTESFAKRFHAFWGLARRRQLYSGGVLDQLVADGFVAECAESSDEAAVG